MKKELAILSMGEEENLMLSSGEILKPHPRVLKATTLEFACTWLTE